MQEPRIPGFLDQKRNDPHYNKVICDLLVRLSAFGIFYRLTFNKKIDQES